MAEENNITQPGTYNPMENMSLPSENVETPNVELPNVGVPPPPSISPNIASQNLVKSEKYNYSDPMH